MNTKKRLEAAKLASDKLLSMSKEEVKKELEKQSNSFYKRMFDRFIKDSKELN